MQSQVQSPALRELHGWLEYPLSAILTGDVVMGHPEDQFEYRATRTRTTIELRSMNGTLRVMEIPLDRPNTLWVRK